MSSALEWACAPASLVSDHYLFEFGFLSEEHASRQGSTASSASTSSKGDLQVDSFYSKPWPRPSANRRHSIISSDAPLQIVHAAAIQRSKSTSPPPSPTAACTSQQSLLTAAGPLQPVSDFCLVEAFHFPVYLPTSVTQSSPVPRVHKYSGKGAKSTSSPREHISIPARAARLHGSRDSSASPSEHTVVIAAIPASIQGASSPKTNQNTNTVSQSLSIPARSTTSWALTGPADTKPNKVDGLSPDPFRLPDSVVGHEGLPEWYTGVRQTGTDQSVASVQERQVLTPPHKPIWPTGSPNRVSPSTSPNLTTSVTGLSNNPPDRTKTARHLTIPTQSPPINEPIWPAVSPDSACVPGSRPIKEFNPARPIWPSTSPDRGSPHPEPVGTVSPPPSLLPAVRAALQVISNQPSTSLAIPSLAPPHPSQQPTIPQLEPSDREHLAPTWPAYSSDSDSAPASWKSADGVQSASHRTSDPNSTPVVSADSETEPSVSHNPNPVLLPSPRLDLSPGFSNTRSRTNELPEARAFPTAESDPGCSSDIDSAGSGEGAQDFWLHEDGAGVSALDSFGFATGAMSPHRRFRFGRRSSHGVVPETEDGLTEREWLKLRGDRGQVLSMAALLRLVRSGGMERHLRPEVWPLLLGCRQGSDDLSVQQRSGTAAEVEWAKLTSIMADPNLVVQQYVANGGSEPWDVTVRRVHVDVIRMDRGCELLVGDLRPVTLQRLERLLCAFALSDTVTSYCQGMTDLALPLLELYSKDDKAYWCFKALIRKLHSNFQEGMEPLQQQMVAVRQLLGETDPQLGRHIARVAGEGFEWAFQMLLLNFRREMHWHNLFLFWECLWASEATCGSPLAVQVAVVLLQRQRAALLKMNNVEEVHQFMNRFPKPNDVVAICQDALQLALGAKHGTEAAQAFCGCYGAVGPRHTS